jgi:N utilization substance protein A
VEITGVAREPGWRSKIAVISHADGVDPVGACVGPRGSRVRMVVSELRGEKIDIIPYNEEPARFVAKALSPARVREVLVDDETKEATVIVPDDQLSLAIGRDGQNARLAARLTGWKVDITSETDFAQQDQDIEYEGEEGAADGRCMAILTTGRRCPNAALDSSSYCGLPTHQALARFKTAQVAVLSPLSEQELTTLADAGADAAAVKTIVESAEAQFDEAAAEAEQKQAEEAEAEAAAAEAEAEDRDGEEALEETEAEAGVDAPEAAIEPDGDEPAAEAEAPEDTAAPEEAAPAEEPEVAEVPEADGQPEAAEEPEADGQPAGEAEPEPVKAADDQSGEE